MHDRAARADDPDVARPIPKTLKKPGTSPVAHARQVEREPLGLERAARGNARRTRCGRPRCRRRRSRRRSSPTRRRRSASPEARRGQALEALAVVAKDHPARAGHQHRPAGQRLHPPEIAALARVQLLPVRARRSAGRAAPGPCRRPRRRRPSTDRPLTERSADGSSLASSCHSRVVGAGGGGGSCVHAERARCERQRADGARRGASRARGSRSRSTRVTG